MKYPTHAALGRNPGVHNTVEVSYKGNDPLWQIQRTNEQPLRKFCGMKMFQWGDQACSVKSSSCPCLLMQTTSNGEKQRFPVKMWRSHVGVTETPVVAMLWLSEPSWAFSEANNSLTERFTGESFSWLIIFVSYSHDPCRQTHSVCEARWPSFDFRIETLQGVSFAHGAKSWIIREFWL